MTLSEMKVRHSISCLEPTDMYKVLYSLLCQIVSVSHILLDEVQILPERKHSAHGSLPLPAELGLLQPFMLSLHHRGNLCPQITAEILGHGSVPFCRKTKLCMIKKGDLSARRKLSEKKCTKQSNNIIIRNLSVFW